MAAEESLFVMNGETIFGNLLKPWAISPHSPASIEKIMTADIRHQIVDGQHVLNRLAIRGFLTSQLSKLIGQDVT